MYETTTLSKTGWNYEGVNSQQPATGNAVYRLYNPNSGKHFYPLSVIHLSKRVGTMNKLLFIRTQQNTRQFIGFLILMPKVNKSVIFIHQVAQNEIHL